MTKIKLNLCEGIQICTVFPNVGLICTTLFLIFTLISKQDKVVYIGIGISYLVCIALLVISLIICFIVNKNSKKELILNDDTFTIFNRTYNYNQIVSCKYYVCKWYDFVFPIFYFCGREGGLIEIKLQTVGKIRFKVLYRDYLKIKLKIPNIVEK